MQTRFIATVLAVLLAGSVNAGEIHYERIFPLIDAFNNRLSIVLTADDRMLVKRPGFMADAGTHAFEIEPASRAAIERGLQQVATAGVQLENRIAMRSENELVHVADADITVIRVYDADGRMVRELWGQGVQSRSRAFADDPDLGRLAQIEQEIWSLMDRQLAGDGREM